MNGKEKKELFFAQYNFENVPECLKKNMETSFFLAAVFLLLALFFLFQPNIRVMAIVALLISLAFTWRLVTVLMVAVQNQYMVLRGVVVAIQKPRFAAVVKLFSNPLQAYTVRTLDGECTIFLSQNKKIIKGNTYLFCFRERKNVNTGNDRLDAFMNIGQFLGFQEIERKEEDHDD